MHVISCCNFTLKYQKYSLFSKMRPKLKCKYSRFAGLIPLDFSCRTVYHRFILFLSLALWAGNFFVNGGFRWRNGGKKGTHQCLYEIVLSILTLPGESVASIAFEPRAADTEWHYKGQSVARAFSRRQSTTIKKDDRSFSKLELSDIRSDWPIQPTRT